MMLHGQLRGRSEHASAGRGSRARRVYHGEGLHTLISWVAQSRVLMPRRNRDKTAVYTLCVLCKSLFVALKRRICGG